MMKAAVLHKIGESPRYEDFPDPTPTEDQLLVRVKAVAFENIDKALANGTHYSASESQSNLPVVAGLDGIGMLDDGQLVGFGGVPAPYGSMAEKTLIPNGYYVPVPEGVDAVTAAAYPASVLTSLFPLKWGANLQPGQTVLINGATGVSGKLAVQIAKVLGAGRVIGTGRNEASLKRVLELGADAVIDLKQPDDAIVTAFEREAGESGFDVILDFLWGHPTELLLKALTPHELSFAKHKIRLVQIGEMADSTVSLPAEALRTSGLEIVGGAAGLTAEAMMEGTNLVWDMIKDNKVHMDIEQVPLKDIESVWRRGDFQGTRIVVIP